VRGERALEKGQEEFAEIVTTDDRFVDFVEQWWPPVEPIEMWRTLPDVIDRLSQGTFSRVEVEALKTSWAAGEPSIQDVPLIDELRYLVGELPEVTDDDDEAPKQLMSFERREREERVDRFRSTQSIEDDGFAHVLVDEAQDLSPMQWRMLGRRGRHASWTIVGDEAQSSWPHPRESAAARKAALDGKPEHAFRLSTNYRNSAEIYELAAKVAAVGVPDPDLADAVRRTGEEPRQLLVEPSALVDAARHVDGHPHLRQQRTEVERRVAIGGGPDDRVVGADDEVALALQEQRPGRGNRDDQDDGEHAQDLGEPPHEIRCLHRPVVPTVVSSWVARVRTT
jgi:hypothetical protein